MEREPLPTIAGRNAVSPDGQWLAIADNPKMQVVIYRLPTAERVTVIASPPHADHIEFSQAGDEFVVASLTGVQFWETKTWRHKRTLTNFVNVFLGPDRHSAWLMKDLRTAGLYDARTATPLLPLPTDMLPIAVSRDGRHLAVRTEGQRLKLWNVAAVRTQLRELGIDWPP